MKKVLILLAVLVCSNFADAQVRASRKAMTAVRRPEISTRPGVSSLPIRRVILYSNGVAYIERRGMVTGDAQIDLSFKQSQVDDVLKSMIVLDLGQGKIGAVSYNSSAPVSARMSEIPFSVEPVSQEGSGIAGVLSQLQGAQVSVVSTKSSAVGSVLTVERKTIRSEKGNSTTSVLVIASDGGEISSFDLDDVRSIKLLEEGTRTDVREFANATASARRLDAKTITVTSEGTGTREMLVSYTVAAPIWKTTYRVVLDEKGEPFFQGWAIVDNISEEDWEAVQMSLVSGSPVSFIQNLQKPFYRYRPVVPTPRDLQLHPQVYEPQGVGTGSGYGDGDAGTDPAGISGTLVDANGAVVAGASITMRNESTGQTYSTGSDSSGNFSRSGLPAGRYSVTANAPGFKSLNVSGASLGRNLTMQLEVGTISEVVTVSAEQIQNLPMNGRNLSSLLSLSAGAGGSNTFILDGVETSMSEALVSGRSGVTTAAKGDEIGDLFEYKIERPVTVLRNRSALIPIIQTKMEGERVAVYNESVRRDRPFSGVLLKNTTGLTFESGSMTVIDGNAYAGEALMERLKPKEQRLISFALDLGTHVKVLPKKDREPAKLIKASGGVLRMHYFSTQEKVYTISNQTERPKTVYIEYPIAYGWELSDRTPKPDYTTQSFYRFRIELNPFEEKEMTVALRQPLVDTYKIGSITNDQLLMFVAQKYITEETRIRLEKMISIRSGVGQLDSKLESFDNEVQKISTDQKRLRENIESLSKTAEAKTLIARYIAKANDQESKLEQLEKDRKTTEAEKERLEHELAVEIKNFEIK